ncbi:MAG: hypothetical protein A2X86_20715 [Bdellovibrionales bacterium GWA2_49_15]|nr:MAG: hypothetical protein A2X86_20715 [Bdellovibrionales bacterium GWA2_49_15]HAZ11261.1 hypothetical protein [Bdellovibrionales bacterium]
MDTQGLKAYYDQAFKKKLESTPGECLCSPSLLAWTDANSSIWYKNDPMLAIELGCGAKSVLVELSLPEKSKCFGVDFSRVTIDHALLNSQNDKIVYECFDVLEMDTHLSVKNFDFDLVIDGHLFHCLTNERVRQQYLSSVLRKLQVKRGYFVLECMVETGPLAFADDFLFLEDVRVLLQQIGKNAVPVRYIPRIDQLLEQFKQSGFKIVKFLCPPGWKIIADSRRVEPIDGDPGLARFLLAPM